MTKQQRNVFIACVVVLFILLLALLLLPAPTLECYNTFCICNYGNSTCSADAYNIKCSLLTFGMDMTEAGCGYK